MVLNIVLGFVNRTLFIRLLGAEYLGINGLFADILMMLSLADLGLTTAMAYSYYKPIAEKDTAKLSSLVRYYKRIYQFLAVAVAVCGLLLVPFLRFLVRTDRVIPNLELYYVLILANTVVSYLFVFKSTLISADQRQYVISRTHAFISVMRTIGQIIALLVFRAYEAYLITNIIFTVIQNLVISRKADELYPFINEKSDDLSKEEKKSIFTNISSLFIYKTATMVMNGTDNTLISVMVGTVWVGIYSNYNMIINYLNGFVNLLYSSSTASIGNIIASQQKKQRQDAFLMIQTLSLLVATFTTICLGILITDFINVWLGGSFLLDQATTIVIIFNFYLMGIMYPIWSFREASGLFNQTKHVMPIVSGINLVLSVILGRPYGVTGILFASSIARITNICYEPRILFRMYLDLPVRQFYLPLITNFVIVAGSLAALHWGFSYFPVNGWLTLFLKACVTGLLALGITLLVYRKTSGYQMIKQRVLALVRR